MVCQEFLAEAAGADTRMFLVNGRPLERDGVYAAFRREGAGDDMRSNISAGGTAKEAAVGERELEIAEMVRPQLLRDGLFMVGIDIAGGILLEVNVFSPGGLGMIAQDDRRGLHGRRDPGDRAQGRGARPRDRAVLERHPGDALAGRPSRTATSPPRTRIGVGSFEWSPREARRFQPRREPLTPG